MFVYVDPVTQVGGTADYFLTGQDIISSRPVGQPHSWAPKVPQWAFGAEASIFPGGLTDFGLARLVLEL